MPTIANEKISFEVKFVQSYKSHWNVFNIITDVIPSICVNVIPKVKNTFEIQTNVFETQQIHKPRLHDQSFPSKTLTKKTLSKYPVYTIKVLMGIGGKCKDNIYMPFQEVNCKMRLFAMKYSIEFEETIN